MSTLETQNTSIKFLKRSDRRTSFGVNKEKGYVHLNLNLKLV